MTNTKVTIELITDERLIEQGYNYEFTVTTNGLAMRNGIVSRITEAGLIAMFSGEDIPKADRPRGNRIKLREGESTHDMCEACHHFTHPSGCNMQGCACGRLR